MPYELSAEAKAAILKLDQELLDLPKMDEDAVVGELVSKGLFMQFENRRHIIDLEIKAILQGDMMEYIKKSLGI